MYTTIDRCQLLHTPLALVVAALTQAAVERRPGNSEKPCRHALVVARPREGFLYQRVGRLAGEGDAALDLGQSRVH